ncbi:MAG TPA: hypothetical protein ENN80_07085, partial [Candidatus Hydrogenedentes bacterium]|nr:hypothetical protein [Candidatus Hydrogenedentota bacterium]
MRAERALASVCLLLGLAGCGHVHAAQVAFEAEEARQGVAVDEDYVYVVGTQCIGKYDKRTHERLAHWEASDALPIIHLDSGVVVDQRLYCAHSNYPEKPMTSSVEIWDADTLEHVGNHSFGIGHGSCTWVDRHDGWWWVAFAHYAGHGGYPDRDNAWTTLVRYDDEWREREAWVFPKDVLERFGDYSCSGGSWGPDGRLYCTGHDRPELYALALPEAGSVLRLVRLVPFPNDGQGIAFDRSTPPMLY